VSGGLTTKSARPSPLSVASRWLLYAGLMLLVGAPLLAVVCAGEVPRRLPAVVASGCCLGTVGAAGIAWDAAQAAHLGLGDLAGTSIGRQLLGREAPILAAGVLAACAFALPLTRRYRRVMVTAVGVAGLAAMWGDVAASHASAARSWRLERMAAQWAHFAAAGVWVGGLVALLTTIGEAGDKARLTRRFSAIALGSVVVLAVSGTQRAYDEIGSIHRLVSTGFGQDVVVKSSLLAVMVGLGAVNRFRSVPAVARTVAPLRALVRGEVLLAGGVLAATGVLQGLAPPTSLPSPPRPLILHGADFATSVRLTLSLTPATVGFNRFTLAVADYDTGAPAGTAAFLRFALPARPDLGSSTLTLSRSRPGTYTGFGANLSIDGAWTVTAVIQTAAGGVEVPFQVSTRSPPERITVEHNPGLPDVYTLQLPQQRTVQVYLDPGRAGFNEFHLTFIGEDGQETPMSTASVITTPGGALPVRRLDQVGHFVADLAGATPRTYRFQMAATTRTGDTVAGTFTIRVR
jgi:putative copper export protein